MTLGDAIEHLEEYLSNDVAFAKLDRNEPTEQQLVYFRITGARILHKAREWESDKALIAIESTPMEKDSPTGLSVRDLLATLRQLPAQYTSYPLAASGLEIEVEGEDVPMRLDYPIAGLGPDQDRQLCLLIYQRGDRAAKPWWKFWRRT